MQQLEFIWIVRERHICQVHCSSILGSPFIPPLLAAFCSYLAQCNSFFHASRRHQQQSTSANNEPRLSLKYSSSACWKQVLAETQVPMPQRANREGVDLYQTSTDIHDQLASGLMAAEGIASLFLSLLVRPLSSRERHRCKTGAVYNLSSISSRVEQSWMVPKTPCNFARCCEQTVWPGLLSIVILVENPDPFVYTQHTFGSGLYSNERFVVGWRYCTSKLMGSSVWSRLFGRFWWWLKLGPVFDWPHDRILTRCLKS